MKVNVIFNEFDRINSLNSTSIAPSSEIVQGVPEAFSASKIAIYIT